PWLHRPEMLVITGSRQTGKTFLVHTIIPHSLKKQVLYYNFEDFSLRGLFHKDPHGFVAALRNSNNLYIFDEFQHVPQLISLLKVAYDTQKQLFPKILLTGSSSLAIQEHVSQSLTGQAMLFHLFSLSFAERFRHSTVDFITQPPQIHSLQNEWHLHTPQLQQQLTEYMRDGGYPELGELPMQLRPEKLSSIIQTILEKDMTRLVKEEYLFAAKQLLDIFASRIGQRISFEAIASMLQLNVKTVRHLASIIAGLFFIDFVYPRSSHGNEYKKSPKVYFHDAGIRNTLLHIAELPTDMDQWGSLVEQFVFHQLVRFSAYQRDLSIHYWQDYNKNEVDFVVEYENNLISIEVKYQQSQTNRLAVGIRNFITRYKPKYHITVTKEYIGETLFNGCPVYFIPAHLFGLLI
ncbi:MAG TPA: ATP-binding protein, partial [Patescibacteria group bacterium]|nr:ATP-binding protein [Patescibacteria group bacterium]